MTSSQYRDRRGPGDPDVPGRWQALLTESGVDADPDDGLLGALSDLASLGADEPPEPSPDLVPLLARPSGDAPRLGGRRPVSRRARVAVASVAAAVCLSGMGAAAAAAVSEGFRHSVGHTFAVVVGGWEGARPEVRPTHDEVPAEADGTTAPAAPGSTPALLLPPDPTSAARTQPGHQPSVSVPFPSASGIPRVDPNPAGSLPPTTPPRPAPVEPSVPAGAPGEPSAHPTRSSGARPTEPPPTSRPSPTRR